jgi:hypothetical protein
MEPFQSICGSASRNLPEERRNIFDGGESVALAC